MRHLLITISCNILLIISAFGNPIEYAPSVMFKQLSTTEGLSNNNVRSIYRDSRGFLWIGTESGLNKYDGYSFQQYYINNSNLTDDAVNDIFEAPDGNIWIKTYSGYNIYDFKKGEFDNNYKAALSQYKIPSKNILQIGKSPEDELWAYDSSKLYLRNKDNGSVKAYPLPKGSISNIYIDIQSIYIMQTDGKLYAINRASSQTLQIPVPFQYATLLNKQGPKIYADANGTLWIYTSENSLLLNKRDSSDSWEEIEIDKGYKKQYNRIEHLLDLEDGNMWILTSHMGLIIYNRLNNSITHQVHNPLKQHTLASNNLNAVFRDKDGTVYIGNFKHGISYYTPTSQIILCNKSLEYDDVLTFCKDNDKNYIYYGTDGTGLIRQSIANDTYTKIETPANVVVDLSTDQKGRVWIGTFEKGLLCYQNGKPKQYTTSNSPLLDNSVYSVKVDKHGYIWIGTMRGYIQRINPETESFETILYRPGEFFIRDMYYDQDKSLYVASTGGIIEVNTDTKAYRIYADRHFFKENSMLTVYKDSRGLIWIGHPHGLSIWNKKEDSVTFIDQKDGLPANLVRAIIEDNNKQMWVATGNGLSRIRVNHNQYSIVNYSVEDGLICNDTNIHAIIKLDNGNILIGTPKGYQTIIPQELITTTYNADIYLTGIELKTGKFSPDILRGTSLECAEKIWLTEKENSFTLYVSSLDIAEANKIKYAYKIDNQNSDWILAEGNKINFSMLPSGEYNIAIKACNPQGIWSPNVKHISIRVLPSWYRTWWAYTLYICIATAIIIYIIRFFQLRNKQKQIFLSIEAENEKQKKLSDMKLQFFANISHELRTPLSLIINPLEEFFQEHPEHKKGMLTLVKQNADYLLELINQLLDFRKLDAKAEKLKCCHENIMVILNEIFHSFDPIANKKNIKYTFTTSQETILIDFDYDKFRKMCTNLLSNAFKFTPNKGCIDVTVDILDSKFVLAVSDTGCGIDNESKEKVFQRFYQSEKNNSSSGGSGIGLHIVSEYVKMHHGSINIKDNKPNGSIFTITMPLVQEQKEYEEVIKEQEIENEQEHQFTILLVDDNHDFLLFLYESMSKLYKVVKATNGKQALDVLKKEDVDLVVSDVMMPEMDGLELCTAIKNDIRYSHIPVILLTAKASEEHQLEGLSTGADDYITKPFNMEVLKLRINKIIEMNVRRKELFNNEIKIEPSHITITSLDQQLVEKAIQIVEDNIGESEFSVEELANCLNISRSYFYKKLIKITGKKPIEFIRTIRMKRAQQLLLESQMQVSEIAYTLGYNSPKVFSKNFKEEFNISPSDYIRQHTKE